MKLQLCETKQNPPTLLKQLKRWLYKNGLWYDGHLNSILFIKDYNVNIQFYQFAGRIWVRLFQRPYYDYSRVSPVSSLKGLISKIDKFMSKRGIKPRLFEEIVRVYVPTRQHCRKRKLNAKDNNKIHFFIYNSTLKLFENVLQV